MRKPYLYILFSAVLTSVMLGGCTNFPTLKSGLASPQEAQRLTQQNRFHDASRMYMTLADQATEQTIREHYLLLSAEVLVDNGQYTQGGQLRIDAIPEQLSSPDLQNRLSLLRAKEALVAGDTEAALNLLPNSEEQHSAAIKARIFEVQANAYNALGQPAEELYARVRLGELLEPDQQKQINNQLIWQQLSSYPDETLRRMTTSVYGDTYQGWLELALIPRSKSLYARQLTAKVENWRQRFPDHPASRELTNSLLAESLEALPETPAISNIAVLLPLSGEMQNVGQAIRDGIITAYLTNNENNDPPQLRFYDTAEKNFSQTYQQALREGATFIIGPLDKSYVASLSLSSDLAVPTLALNYTETSENLPNNLLQFGLLPEDEAVSAAHRALQLNYNNALVLHPDDLTGERMAAAFKNELEALGGNVINMITLARENFDFSQQLREALLIDSSSQRYRALQSTIGIKLKFEPIIRQDVDVIYLASDAKQARLVKPQLLFFRAREIPLLASSRVNDGITDSQKDSDLNNIVFSDTTWAIETETPDRAKSEILNNWPDATPYIRLYALGSDALNVLPFIANMQKASDYRFSGHTGDLSIDEANKIHRHLPWATYENGKAIPLDGPAMPIQKPSEQAPFDNLNNLQPEQRSDF